MVFSYWRKSGGLSSFCSSQRRVLDGACPCSVLVNTAELVWFAGDDALMALLGEGFLCLLQGSVWVRLSPQMLGLPLLLDVQAVAPLVATTLSFFGFRLLVAVLEQMGCLYVWFLVPLLGSGLICPSCCFVLAVGELRLFLGLGIDVPIT